MKASETWARLRDRVISWNRMRLTRADALQRAEAERDAIRIEWNRWVQINSAWIADRAACEMARDEALRDVMQLHDAAIETEDKMDALKADHAALAAALRKAYEPGVREELGVFCDNWVEAAKEQADAKRGGDWIEVICGLRTILARYSALPADVAELLRRVEGRKEE